MGRYKKREMPGVTARALLREAGFADVASRDTPPPIVLYTPIATPDMIVNARFKLYEGDAKLIMRKMLHKEVPRLLAAAIREAHTPVVY